MKILNHLLLIAFLGVASFISVPGFAQEPVDFVVQLTKSNDNYGKRRTFLQIDKALHDIGKDRVRFTVVAYGDTACQHPHLY